MIKTPHRFFKIFILIMSIHSFFLHAQELAVDKPNPGVAVDTSIFSDGYVSITGEHQYPLPFILGNLALKNWIPKADQKNYRTISGLQLLRTNEKTPKPRHPSVNPPTPGARILSLGEGISPFVPWLRSMGVDALGVDLWYEDSLPDLPEYIRPDRYRKKHKDVLIQDNAATLAKLPRNAPFDHIIAHYLFPYLSVEDQESMLKESISLLKPGGTLHLNRAEVFLSPAAAEYFEVLDGETTKFSKELDRIKSQEGIHFIEKFSETHGVTYWLLAGYVTTLLRNPVKSIPNKTDFMKTVLPYTADLYAGYEPPYKSVKEWYDAINKNLYQRDFQTILIIQKPLTP